MYKLGRTVNRLIRVLLSGALLVIAFVAPASPTKVVSADATASTGPLHSCASNSGGWYRVSTAPLSCA